MNTFLYTMEYWDLPYEYSPVLANQIDNHISKITQQDTIILFIKKYRGSNNNPAMIVDTIFKKYDVIANAEAYAIAKKLCENVVSMIITTENVTLAQLKGLIYCECSNCLVSYAWRPNSTDDCNNAEHPLNMLLALLGAIIKDVEYSPMQEVLSIIGTSLIVQTMLPFLPDLNKDFNSIEIFFLERYVRE